MATETELKDIANRVVMVFENADLTVGEVAGIAVNVYGFLMQQCGASVHHAVGAVMEYYKSNADH